MEVFRLSGGLFAKDLNGEGAKINGGRWNSVGTPMIYSSAHISLCTVELACNSGGLLGLKNLQLLSIEIDAKVEIEIPLIQNLPKGWQKLPTPTIVSKFGDRWINSCRSLVMKVPSAVIPDEYNFLINPIHPLFPKRIKINWVKPFNFDPRIVSQK